MLNHKVFCKKTLEEFNVHALLNNFSGGHAESGVSYLCCRMHVSSSRFLYRPMSIKSFVE